MIRRISRVIVLSAVALAASWSIAGAQTRRFAPAAAAPDRMPEAALPSVAGYEATRLLVARSAKLNRMGWLEAVTIFRPGHGFSYTIVGEGGDAGIRNRVLRKVLENEVELTAPGRSSRVAISEANYAIARDAARPVLYLSPRRQEPTLIDGVAHLDARGRLRTLEGRLAKSPSFWVRSITVRRTYQTVGGHALPVLVESLADVKLAGPCQFSMWIDYTSVDGRRLNRGAARPRPSVTEPSTLLLALQQQLTR